MKNRDLFNAIGNVDPDMIAAADKSERRQSK